MGYATDRRMYPPCRNRGTTYGTTYGRPTWDMALLELVSSPGLFRCPSDRLAERASFTDAQGQTVRGWRSYAVHSNPGGLLSSDKGGLFFDENNANAAVLNRVISATDNLWPGITINFDRIEEPGGTWLIADRHTWSRTSNMYNDFATRFGAGFGLPADVAIAGVGSPSHPAHDENYQWLFVDGHAASRRIPDTYGQGSETSPQGMWTRWRD